MGIKDKKLRMCVVVTTDEYVFIGRHELELLGIYLNGIICKRSDGKIVTRIPSGALRVLDNINFDRRVSGIITPNNEIVVSINRHDFRFNLEGRYFIDGGKDYFRTNCQSCKIVEVDMLDKKVYHQDGTVESYEVHTYCGDE
jgi:hypothetical protein